MQVYANSNKLSIKILLAIFIILIVAYLPISSFQFALKNDSFTGYFPPKFFISESLHAGYLPLWHPYLNYGFPIYADMSSGFWNPITWLIAGTVGYNAYTYTLEELFYILIAGIGMYYLTSFWKIQRPVRFISAISYMCCGYFIGHLQHLNWLEGAAFLPWTFFAYLLCTQRLSWRRALFAGLTYYMLIASAHPGLIIASFYLFVALGLAKIISAYRTNGYNYLKKFAATHISIAFILILFGLGIVISYSEIFPFISRGAKLSLLAADAEPTTIQSWISFAFPFSTSRDLPFKFFFHNDHTVRNCYVGLVILLFFLLSLVSKKNRWQIFFLVIGIAFLLLSSGGIFKAFAYKFVPLIGYVRISGEFRIISLFCFILTGTMALNNYIIGGWKYSWKLRWILNAGFVVWILTILGSFFMIFSTGESIFYDFRTPSNGENVAGILKRFIDSFSIYDCFVIQGLIQLVLWTAIYKSIHNRKLKVLLCVSVIDLVLASLMNIPFTGVSKVSVAEFQSLINRSPKNIPIPELQPVSKNAKQSVEIERMIGSWGWYNKQIGTIDQIPYPVIFNTTQKFFNSNLKDSADLKPYAFFQNDSGTGMILVKHFSPTEMVFSTSTTSETGFILKQNIYRGWICRIDNQIVPIDTALITFIKCDLQKGSHEVKFEFRRQIIQWSLWINFTLIVISFVTIIYLAIRKGFIHT